MSNDIFMSKNILTTKMKLYTTGQFISNENKKKKIENKNRK